MKRLGKIMYMNDACCKIRCNYQGCREKSGKEQGHSERRHKIKSAEYAKRRRDLFLLKPSVFISISFVGHIVDKLKA
jgi:hypothetical protein